MSEELCPVCRGSGECAYLKSGDTFQKDGFCLDACTACRGTGFERAPTYRSLVETNESLDRAMVALDRAIAALSVTAEVKP